MNAADKEIMARFAALPFWQRAAVNLVLWPVAMAFYFLLFAAVIGASPFAPH